MALRLQVVIAFASCCNAGGSPTCVLGGSILHTRSVAGKRSALSSSRLRSRRALGLRSAATLVALVTVMLFWCGSQPCALAGLRPARWALPPLRAWWTQGGCDLLQVMHLHQLAFIGWLLLWPLALAYSVAIRASGRPAYPLPSMPIRLMAYDEPRHNCMVSLLALPASHDDNCPGMTRV